MFFVACKNTATERDKQTSPILFRILLVCLDNQREATTAVFCPSGNAPSQIFQEICGNSSSFLPVCTAHFLLPKKKDWLSHDNQSSTNLKSNTMKNIAKVRVQGSLCKFSSRKSQMFDTFFNFSRRFDNRSFEKKYSFSCHYSPN